MSAAAATGVVQNSQAVTLSTDLRALAAQEGKDNNKETTLKKHGDWTDAKRWLGTKRSSGK